MSGDDVIISTRIPKKLRELMRKYVLADTFMNESEFVRYAIRKELERRGVSFDVGEQYSLEKGGDNDY